jgi:hypothetical protein
MCYHCLSKCLLGISDSILAEKDAKQASEGLLNEYGNFVSILLLSSKWSEDSKGAGKTNPLTFSFIVVAEHMKEEWEKPTKTTPKQMKAFLEQVVKRMATVEQVNPYDKAVLGSNVMPPVVQTLLGKLDLD